MHELIRKRYTRGNSKGHQETIDIVIRGIYIYYGLLAIYIYIPLDQSVHEYPPLNDARQIHYTDQKSLESYMSAYDYICLAHVHTHS